MAPSTRIEKGSSRTFHKPKLKMTGTPTSTAERRIGVPNR